MARALDAVVFDLDGTLVDSAGDLQACANQLLAELGLSALGLAEVTSFIGEGIPPLIERCLTAAGRPLTGAPFATAIERYKAIYAAAPAVHTRPYAGVADCLDLLGREGLRLGLCTNKSEPLAREVIAAVGLGRHFSVIVGGDTLPLRKPDPAPLLHTARLLGAGVSRVVYVGDSEIDAAAAEAAGIPFVLFTRGYRKTPVEALKHVARFEEFAELVNTLHSLPSSVGSRNA